MRSFRKPLLVCGALAILLAGGVVRSAAADVQAPAAPGTQAVHAFTARAFQNESTAGAFATLSIERPHLAPGDHLSSAQVYVESADKLHAIAIGWHVNPGITGDH